MNKIKGVYTFFSKEKDIKLCDYEIGILLISLLKWKEYYGHTQLITNEKGLKYFKTLGLDELWDEITLEDTILDEIDTETFPNAMRIHLLDKLQPPYCLLEYDTIIQQPLTDVVLGSDFAFTYLEDSDVGKLPNTNFMFINNIKTIKKYTTIAKRFMADTHKLTDLTPKDKFFKNIELDVLLFNTLEKNNSTINYIFYEILNKDSGDIWPFDSLNNILTGNVFLLSKYLREAIRARVEVYDSYTKEIVLEQNLRREQLFLDVKECLQLVGGKEYSDILKSIVEDNELVDLTVWEKGIKFTDQGLNTWI